VDAFLDRVEATLAGDPIGPPVTAQEVHDVVFRVRFGGYDEWQVDLHLDRVERQLAEAEERGGVARPDGRREDRLAGLGAEPLEQRRPSVPPPMPTRPLTPMPVGQMAGGPMAGPMGGGPMAGGPMMGNGMPPMMAPPPMSAPPMSAPPLRPMSGPPLPPLPPIRPMSAPPLRPMSAPPLPPGNGYPRYDDEHPTGGFSRGFPGPGPDQGMPQVGRRGRMDMTHEMRFDANGSGSAKPTSGAPVSPSDVQRIDSMRRTFTARRFGSGYDAMQVNRLFDAIIASLSGQSGVQLSEAELDPNQFSLVPGGYFEAEVNQALREVRELVRR